MEKLGVMEIKSLNSNYALLNLFVLLTFLFLGCSRNQLGIKNFEKKRDQLYIKYSESDAEKAQQCLLDILELLEQPGVLRGATINPKVAIARERVFVYSRLHVLATRTGNKVNAEAYLLKAQYWLLVQCELSGVSTEESMTAVHTLTSDYCREFVIFFDNGMTQGKGPKYARGLDPSLK